MAITAINAINYRKNNQNLTFNGASVTLVSSRPQSEMIYPNYNILKAQALFKPSKTNVISFKGGLTPGLFKKFAATELHPNWELLIKRETQLYSKPNELRSEFSRDFDRILHSEAYNRTIFKTQVFSQPHSDVTTTRIHHINQVASIAENISEFLGLNPKLARAQAIGHDVGHAPFGHGGEKALAGIMEKHNIKPGYWQGGFWHEKNSLRFIDDIETKLDPNGYEQNLDLTYGVRDGIISHCGEVDENGLRPRTEHLDLRTIPKSNRPQPFTWEGCVVKISDKIAYLGKDLEDSIKNGFLHPDKKKILISTIKETTGLDFEEINNTVLINHFIGDLCENSNPKDGLRFSEKTFKLMNAVKKFNYDYIYKPKDKIQAPYCDLVINTVYENLANLYDGKNTLSALQQVKGSQPKLAKSFSDWLVKYSDVAPAEKAEKRLANKTIYSIENPEDYKTAVVEFISGMTDKSARESFEEITFFG